MMLKAVVTITLVALARAGCPNQCSLNGVCDGDTCACDDGWTWDDCSRLDLLPAPSSVSFHGLDVNKSSWGGSVLRLPVNGEMKWAMFAAEMTRDCTLRHWTTNSEVVLALSDNPMGPYKESFQIIPPWAHNPEAITTPDGNIVVYTLGDGIPVHGPEYRCDLPPAPPSPNPYPPPPPPAPPSDAVHDVNFLLHYAPTDKFTDRSAWQAHNATILDFPIDFKWEGNWNPAPYQLPDGRVRVMVHTGFSGFYNSSNNTVAGWSGEVVIEAANWRGPYRLVTSWDITDCTHCEEDPFMWQDHRGNWHVIYHRMFDNGTACNGYPSFNPDGKVPAHPCKSPEGLWSMGHSYSADGKVWSPISRCANTTVQLTDGSSVTMVSRERPKLVMGSDGRPAYLSNAVQPFEASAGPDAGVTHTLVVPLNVKQNRN